MALTIVIVICVIIILSDAVPKWIKVWQGKRAIIIEEG
jgi:hypothetical protein